MKKSLIWLMILNGVVLAHNDCVVCSVPAKWEFKEVNQKEQEAFWRAEETACEKHALTALKSRKASSSPRLDADFEFEKENLSKLEEHDSKIKLLRALKRRLSVRK